jgi:hypothetical protein
MAEIFDPVVKQVIALIAEQVRSSNETNKTNKVSVCLQVRKITTQVEDSQSQTIILVGGFGESVYLFSKVEEWASDQPYSIKVINPTFS